MHLLFSRTHYQSIGDATTIIQARLLNRYEKLPVEQRQILIENESSAIGKCDYEIHYNEYQIVVPTGILLAPKARMPDEYLHLDCTEHDENQSHGGELGENSKGDAEPSRKFGGADKNCETLAHANTLASGNRVLERSPSAGDENHADHEPQE
jgi:hypothetical protein